MYLAQFNVSKERAPLDDPLMRDFIESLDQINQLADASDGFVWRLHDETGNATAIRPYDDKSIIFNLSVWRSIELLKQFVYKSQHAEILQRRREWFEPMTERNYVLWWVAEAHRPSVEEAKSRLHHLRGNGESAFAFTFDRAFEPGEQW